MLVGQLMVGLINGSFYAMLSLGMAVIFGLLHIVNFAHGALYMLGAFAAYLAMQWFGIGYWPALIIAPLLVGAFGALLQRTLISRISDLDHIYGLLLTFGLTLIIEGMIRYWFGSSIRSYPTPRALTGATQIAGVYIPIYRIWIIAASLVACTATWYFIEKTRLGAYLRAATENPSLVQVFGVNVPLLITLTFAGASALAGLAGVLAAPVFQVSSGMGAQILILVFGIVVIGGMGSIRGAIITGYSLGFIEGLTKVLYPEGSYVVIFVVMIAVLLYRPSAHAGREG
ncbi:MAG: branched-chain amino acid ABC transporter permease [Burkholderiaceae bacterium]